MTDLEIFNNAPAGATPTKLVAYLDEACGGNDKLRARVETLFAERNPADESHRPPSHRPCP